MRCPGGFGEHWGHGIAGRLLRAAVRGWSDRIGRLGLMLFVGDDWAEDPHDVELIDEQGKVRARRRLPEGLAGVTQLHALVAEHLPDPRDDPDPALQVMVGIETERGPWVGSLVAVSAYDLMCREGDGLTCRSRAGLIMVCVLLR
jgi:hypothetical protein